MALDPTIFDRVGRFPSMLDVDQQRQGVELNRLHSLLLGNEVEQTPLRNRLLALQADTGEIGNEKARQMLTFLRRLAAGSGQPPAAAAPAAMPPSQWSPGGAQGPALPAGAPPVSLPVADTPQGPPAAPQAAAPAPGRPNIGGLGAEDLVAFHALGGPDMLPSLKMLVEGATAAPGSESTDLRTGVRRTVPSLDKGQQVVNGQVSNMPGFVDASAESAGASAAATEAAKANLTPLPIGYVGENGRPVGGTVGAYVGAPRPGQGAPQMPSSFDQLNPQQQTAATADMAARGQNPGAMSVNGAPVHAEEQQQLDAAKAGGPAALARFTQTWMPRLQQIPDPAQRARAIAGFQADLATPPGTPIHSMGPAPAAAAPGGAPRLAAPAQLVGDEAEARKTQERFSQYAEGLDKRVEEGFALQRRNAEIASNLEQFQAGLAGGHVRADLASNLANAFPDSPRIQLLAGKIVGGGPDAPAAAQTFNSLVAGAMISNAIQTLNGQGRLNQGEVKAFQAASESAQTDPRALERIMAIQNRFADQDLAEQQALAAARRNGTFDPRTWTADWAKARREMMRDPNSPFAPASAQPLSASRDPKQRKPFTYLGPVGGGE